MIIGGGGGVGERRKALSTQSPALPATSQEEEGPLVTEKEYASRAPPPRPASATSLLSSILI